MIGTQLTGLLQSFENMILLNVCVYLRINLTKLSSFVHSKQTTNKYFKITCKKQLDLIFKVCIYFHFVVNQKELLIIFIDIL